MSSAQHRLSDYLQYEQYHVLGAYRIAADGLASLAERLESAPETRGDADPGTGSIERYDLLRLTRIVRRYNERLGEARHAANHRDRHPIPGELPLSLAERFKLEPADSDLLQARQNPWVGPMTWAWVTKFYDAAIYALDPSSRKGSSALTSSERMADTLARNLVWRRASSRRAPADAAREQRERDDRRRRSEARRLQAYQDLPGQAREKSGKEQSDAADEFLHRVVNDNLTTASSGSGSLPLFVVYAQAEAHMSMHAVEAWQSLGLGEHAKLLTPDTKRWLERELDRCIALATFAFAASRSTPWIFAENADECRRVFEHFPDAWKNVVPTRCMWIASQVSLLALHRRAYARGMKGRPEEAYNDYHKLQHLIRDTERRVKSAPIHVEGALEFLTGLDAQAHHHIGELYRAQHAQRPALKHFRMASHRIKPLRENARMDPVLTNSRWHVQLQVSQGKAHYEMGRHKESLCWHLRGWRAFLLLLAADTHTEASTEEIDAAVEWLNQVRFEPELRKSEVEEYIRPVVAQLKRITVERRLGALAADILLRLGHLLFVINCGLDGDLPPLRRITNGAGSIRLSAAAREELGREADERIERTLAFACLSKAAECDPHATLVGADLLKARFRVRSWFKHRGRELPREYVDRLQPMELAPVAEQWPRGGDDYERLARVAEYLMLRAQLHEPPPPTSSNGVSTALAEEQENRSLADDLLLNFFMHTDSINVRKSQVHRFLMRRPAEQRPPEGDGRALIEFVCMRRYSSAFPLLPRPSAFRALGGGYFVRLHRKHASDKEPEPPFGIVIDPGVDFVENLYRTGYSVSDIHMVIVTHDHVDHLGSLDPLLSLMHEHGRLSKKEGRARPRRLVVFVNESVAHRYKRTTQLNRSNNFRLLRGLQGSYQPPARVPGFPEGFELQALSTSAIDGTGHRDLSDMPSYGICIRTEDGVSVAVTGDTPCPPDAHASDPATVAQRRRWLETWKPALEADVLVAHLSTVPLTELRKLAGLDAGPQPARLDDIRRIAEQAQALDATCKRYKRQLRGDHVELDGSVAVLRAAARTLSEQTLNGHAKNETLAQTTVRLDGAADDVERRANDLLEELQRCETAPALHPQLQQLVLDARSLALDVRRLPHDAAELNGIRDQLEDADPLLRGQIEFALWLRSHEGTTASLVGAVPDDWKTPPGHAYLGGTLAWAREYRRHRKRFGSGLFVIGELSEELGTVRGKIAGRLNETIFSPPPGMTNGEGEPDRYHALSSDIGLHVVVAPPARVGGNVRARVLCTTCDLDMDREPDERFHSAHEMHEVCVKGENEGIFYNCPEHDPRTQREPSFLEQLERFDVFGR